MLVSCALLASCGPDVEIRQDSFGKDAASEQKMESMQQARQRVIQEARVRAESAQAQADREQAEAEVRRLEAEAQARMEAERAAFDARYPLHGVVTHFLAQVFARPERGAKVIGYMRRGAKFRATARVGTNGCSGGWHEAPGQGFVCSRNGYLLGQGPQSFEPSPVQPALDSALPYTYAHTNADDRPQYWQLPSLEDEDGAANVISLVRRRERAEARASEEAPAAPPVDPDAGTDMAAPEANADEGGETEAAEGVDDGIEAPPPPGQEVEEGTAASEEATEDEGIEFPGYLRQRMRTGFYVSLDGRERTTLGRLFYRTVRGGYVRASDVVENEPPESRGVVLGGNWQLPIGIIFRRGARHYRRASNGSGVIERGRIDRHTPFPIADDRVAEGGRRYIMSRRGMLVRDSSVRVIRQRAAPSGVPVGARWIHVNLSNQSLVAYEGNTPVFATVVSTGREGHETPTGVFRIESKHVSTTMDDLEGESPYSIEDVPWTMYFHGNYALHGAFWHYTFGRPRSHGCVNLAPADARWLFQWSTPVVPPAWHGVFADRNTRAGTFVFVEE